MALEESALDNDEITEKDGLRFLVNEYQKTYFENIAIDYESSWFGRGFTLVSADGNKINGNC
ncbi:hypothetical protein EJF36_15015 [Bacillus sp. HMF5848]|uniref:hypothetical protein n=1 Tax=Bacillus sp. HMF5848 TaxID=2495421 RepID=UPI000F783FC2|nr:hypothetical protein [Bacillus sp. HMF5848]RSK28083.1 hypothetical protein EJF36_15015 [Bacillus sp. HMF5848]